jgi:hypothetical protein
LFRELSSAAVDAELARLAHNWGLGRIEKHVGAFKPAESPAAKRKKAFHALRSGSRLQQGHAVRIQAAFPESNVYLWWAHPLANVLCNPHLGIDELMDYLNKLPPGKVRSVVWQGCFVPAGGHHSERLSPWAHPLVLSLERIGSPVALFALMTRLRIEQLMGVQGLGLESANAAWQILPKAIARSRHLLVAKDALLIALDYFLSWQPFADARLWQMFGESGNLRRRDSMIQCEHCWLSDRSIPMPIKIARRNHLGPKLLPGNLFPSTWWGAFFSELVEEGVESLLASAVSEIAFRRNGEAVAADRQSPTRGGANF